MQQLRMKFLLIILLVPLLEIGQCAKILGIFPLPARSHYILGSSLMRGLAEKGHDVTVINPFGEKTPPKNGKYRDILLTDFVKVGDKGKLNNLFDLPIFNYFQNISICLVLTKWILLLMAS